jgi:hypothetical protein
MYGVCLRLEIGQADSCVPKLELQNAAGRAGGLASGWLQCNYELMADMYDARLNEQPAPACAHVKHTLSESGRRHRLPPWLYWQHVKSLVAALRPGALCGTLAALCSRPRRTISL